MDVGGDGVGRAALGDRRFGDRLSAGLAAGFARDEVKIGTEGSRSKARGASIAGYGSYQAGPRTYIDALLGFGTLRFDSDRFVVPVEEFARAERKGRQVFGSIAGAESVLLAFDDDFAVDVAMAEAPHGTAPSLFGKDIASAGQVRELTGELHDLREHVLLSIDEEGGDVNRLENHGGTSVPGNHALGRLDDPARTREAAYQIGLSLVEAGVDWDLAPAVDAARKATAPKMKLKLIFIKTVVAIREERVNEGKCE